MTEHDYYDKMLHGQPSKKIGKDTIVQRRNKEIVIQFNKTFVVRILADGTYILDTGGWRTPSTKFRINNVIKKTGWRIIQEDHSWYLQRQNIRYVFTDGIKINPDGTVVGAISGEPSMKALHTLINKYVSRFVQEWRQGDVMPPCDGDPWNIYSLCMEKKKVQEADKPELRHYVWQYMHSQYCFGSLLMIAIEEAGGSRNTDLSLIDKTDIEQWLKNGTVSQSKLTNTKSLGKILRSFLRNLFDLGEEL